MGVHCQARWLGYQSGWVSTVKLGGWDTSLDGCPLSSKVAGIPVWMGVHCQARWLGYQSGWVSTVKQGGWDTSLDGCPLSSKVAGVPVWMGVHCQARWLGYQSGWVSTVKQGGWGTSLDRCPLSSQVAGPPLKTVALGFKNPSFAMHVEAITPNTVVGFPEWQLQGDSPETKRSAYGPFRAILCPLELSLKMN